jgi:hypothetical protein
VAEAEETVIGLVTTVTDRASTIGLMMIDLDETTVIVMIEEMVIVAVVAVEAEVEVIAHSAEVGVV